MANVIDMGQYLDLFLQEAAEQIGVLEQETVQLANDPSPGRLNQIFRAAHTLKGSSGAMGFHRLAKLTHEMESLLDNLRSGRNPVTEQILNALLLCVDSLSDIRDGIASTGTDEHDNSEVIQVLQGLNGRSGKLTCAKAPTQLDANTWELLRQTSKSIPVYEANFLLDPECVMKFVRAYMAIALIEDGGELYESIPDVKSLEEEQFEQSFTLYFHHPGSIAQLEVGFKKIGELLNVSIRQITAGSELEPQAESTPALAPVVESSGPAAPIREVTQTVRVDVKRLDQLMNLVGELVIDRTRLAQIGATLASNHAHDPSFESLAETVSHLGRITAELQDILLKARMMPLDTVFNRLPRLVRDIAQTCGKEVQLELIGGHTEMDRSVIEIISDPLLHILRNSVDHGLESPEERKRAGKSEEGKIRVEASHHEGQIVLEITDDGRGIDTQRVRAKAVENGILSQEEAERLPEQEALSLIFASGLSTAKEVTDLSGRGVGMDIVRSNIQRLGGLVDVKSTVGTGTTFRMRLPLTLAIIQGLLVEVRSDTYVLPLSSVVETVIVGADSLQNLGGKPVIVLRGSTTPLVKLACLLSYEANSPINNEEKLFVVIVGSAERRIGIIVDRLVGEQEVVIKSLSQYCGEVPGISGATILGGGTVALIVDVNDLLSLAKYG